MAGDARMVGRRVGMAKGHPEMAERGLPDPNEGIIELTSDCQFDPLAWSLSCLGLGVGALEAHSAPRVWQRNDLPAARAPFRVPRISV